MSSCEKDRDGWVLFLLGFFKAAFQRDYVETNRFVLGTIVLAEHPYLDALVLGWGVGFRLIGVGVGVVSRPCIGEAM